MVELIAFHDGHELAMACAALEDAGIELEVRPSSFALVPQFFEIWVQKLQAGYGQAVLREKRGLFPLMEVEEPDPTEDDGSFAVLGFFETAAEADDAMRALTEAGFEARLVPPDESEGMYAVEVIEVRLEAAQALVARKLGIAE